jgi:hypothetical protein
MSKTAEELCTEGLARVLGGERPAEAAAALLAESWRLLALEARQELARLGLAKMIADELARQRALDESEKWERQWRKWPPPGEAAPVNGKKAVLATAVGFHRLGVVVPIVRDTKQAAAPWKHTGAVKKPPRRRGPPPSPSSSPISWTEQRTPAVARRRSRPERERAGGNCCPRPGVKTSASASYPPRGRDAPLDSRERCRRKRDRAASPTPGRIRSLLPERGSSYQGREATRQPVAWDVCGGGETVFLAEARFPGQRVGTRSDTAASVPVVKASGVSRQNTGITPRRPLQSATR